MREQGDTSAHSMEYGESLESIRPPVATARGVEFKQ
jgi:hypothetical protein